MLQSPDLALDKKGFLSRSTVRLPESHATQELSGHVPSSTYRVRIVRSSEQLQRSVSVRKEAYSRRLPELAQQVGSPEDLDYSHNAIVLLAEDRHTGRPLGTLRLNSGAAMLAMMDDIELPEEITNGQVAYVSRMALVGDGRQKAAVRKLLEKAMFQLCAAKQLRTVLILAVVPRERLFYHWGFTDVFTDQTPRHPQFLNRVPVRVLQCETYSIERTWREMKHPMYDFHFRTFHPELEIFMSVSSLERRSGEVKEASSRFSQRVPVHLE